MSHSRRSNKVISITIAMVGGGWTAFITSLPKIGGLINSDYNTGVTMLIIGIFGVVFLSSIGGLVLYHQFFLSE